MKKLLPPLILAFLCSSVLALEPQLSDVFVAGKDGFKSIRIPAVLVTKPGTVLAFAEGRAAHADQANNKLILKRSRDGGRTWGAVQLVADDGANTLNNPTVVEERASGRVLLMYQSYPAGISERDGKIKPGHDGPAIVRNFLVHSEDDGATWSKPLDVTRTTKRPERVTITAVGPGIGIQLTRGPHAGRLLMPFNEGPFGVWEVSAAFSDDRGATWQLGSPAPGALVTNAKGGQISLVNEVQMAELNDGSVMLNSRKWGGTAFRKTAVSRDGGTTWSAIEQDKILNDPGCMASLFRYSFTTPTDQSRLLYSGPDSTKRENGAVRISYDEGKTWPVKRVLFPGSFAYSVLTRFADGTIGCLYETDDANRLVFARFDLAWLSGGTNLAALPEGRTETTGKFGWWPARHAQKLAETKTGGIEVAFLGDSITQGWETAGKAVWEKHYAGRKAANYGFGGDSTQHVLWRVQNGEFDGLSPKAIVLLVGTNNARHGDFTPEQIAAGIREILNALAEKCPRSKVLLLGILPRGPDVADPIRLKCEAVNALLPALADGQRVHFLNVNAKLLAADGTLPKELAPDLLHLSAKGYSLWADAMEPKLAELLAGQ